MLRELDSIEMSRGEGRVDTKMKTSVSLKCRTKVSTDSTLDLNGDMEILVHGTQARIVSCVGPEDCIRSWLMLCLHPSGQLHIRDATSVVCCSNAPIGI